MKKIFQNLKTRFAAMRNAKPLPAPQAPRLAKPEKQNVSVLWGEPRNAQELINTFNR